ncbi:MAG: riboflavin biosynthesis protein RibF [Planctomycetes bacterium]|nr:riboflavin biosynthesis protein RibF [Planctomycetota bacterium]
MLVSLQEEELPLPAPSGSVASVGVFDGVHRGHREILRTNVARARELGARPTVVTFREHPKTVLLGRAPRMLTSLEHKLELFRRAGIEHAVALQFDAALRDVSAAEFARGFLVGRLGAKKLVLGFDSKLGHGREGTPEFLRALGLDVEVVGQVLVGERPVSSTAIREAVELGDLEGAARMLGRRVAVYGDVVRGNQLGRKLGFPTANLDLHHELRPPIGVYAGFARPILPPGRTPGRRWPAVVNIGFRPTVTGVRPEAPHVEAHLLGFEGDLYGAHLELEFVGRLRDEQRFPDVGSLQRQIELDVSRARALLAAQPTDEGG